MNKAVERRKNAEELMSFARKQTSFEGINVAMLHGICSALLAISYQMQELTEALGVNANPKPVTKEEVK